MADPIQIADAKLSLAVTSAISKLQADVQEIHRRAAAKGMLRSGSTIVEVKDQCVSTLKQLSEAASQELRWALSQTFFASPSTIDACNTVAHGHIRTIGHECNAILCNTASLCGEDRLFEVTEPDLRTQEQQSRMVVSLALDAQYSELKFQRIRAALGFLQRLVQVVVRHGR